MKSEDPQLRPTIDISYYLVTILGVIIVIILYFSYRELIFFSLILGLIVYLGFGLPIWHGQEVRREMACKYKEFEFKKWKFYSRDREGQWINYIDYPLIKESQMYVQGKRFYSEWLIIHDGIIIVNPGYSEVNIDNQEVEYNFANNKIYAWDGCTPKRWFFWLALIGTPDWEQRLENIRIFDKKSMSVNNSKSVLWQKAHHASLVHDALYQYLSEIPISKRDVDQLFFEMLLESGVSLEIAKIYHLAVRFFGARDIEQDDPKNNSELRLMNSLEGFNAE